MKQSEKLTQLLELMQANPELPVIPCVDGDVVSGDEYYCWLGSWGESAVQEFVIGRERTYYREDDISEMNDVLCEHYDPELVDNMTEEETRAAYNALPWKKAIFVDVHQYEEEPDAEVWRENYLFGILPERTGLHNPKRRKSSETLCIQKRRTKRERSGL